MRYPYYTHLSNNINKTPIYYLFDISLNFPAFLIEKIGSPKTHASTIILPTLLVYDLYLYAQQKDRTITVRSRKSIDYSEIEATAPEPTVLPPSRIANLKPSSIAIGVINSTSIATLSPGIHISVPSGN